MGITQILKTGARMVGETFSDPESDWSPILIAKSKNDVQIASPIITSDKESSFAAIEDWLHRVNAEEAAFLVSSWAVSRAEGVVMDGEVREQPDREEVLVLFHVGKGFCRMESAQIERDLLNPPKLGDWRSWPEGPMAGLAAKALKAGIRN